MERSGSAVTNLYIFHFLALRRFTEYIIREFEGNAAT